MNRKLVRTFLTGWLGAGLLIAAVAPSAGAATPRWSLAVTQLNPGGISAGSSQGFDIRIANAGPSNISKLYLLDDVGRTPTYVKASRAGCPSAGKQLTCEFGALRAGETIHVRLAYAMPRGADRWKVTFQLNTTGFVTGGNNSHGDAATNTQTVRVLPAGKGNRAGAWSVTRQFKVANGQDVGRRNRQATRVAGSGRHIPVSVRDGADVAFRCPKADCPDELFGEWSKVDVDGGRAFRRAFEVRITVAKAALPDRLRLAEVVVYHVLDNGRVDAISRSCGGSAPDPGDPECRSVALDAAGNLVMKVYTYRNGGYKGAF